MSACATAISKGARCLSTLPVCPHRHADSFATRRIRCLRRAIPAGLLLRPALPAIIAENSEACPSDKAGKRMLPDSSLWVVSGLKQRVGLAWIFACLWIKDPHRSPPHLRASPALLTLSLSLSSCPVRVSWQQPWSTWRSRASRTCTAPA